MTKSKYTNVLNHRDFNICDGERYLIICNIKNNNQVLTRTYKDKPIFSKKYNDAKTFRDKKSLEKVINLVFIGGGYDYGVYQVKDIFEARYYIKYNERGLIREPNIKCSVDWYVKGENLVNTYIDYDEAMDALKKHKCSLIEYYYTQILGVDTFNIEKIKKAGVETPTFE